ncbi:MAG: LysE family translocator [Proteobacteria bacterium]|nr:LysE family translocator [Desulfobacula sp.]MBU4130044.1 LysE family translocator [Pseudomonadota bacterium]
MEFFLVYMTTVFVASIIPGPSMILSLTHGIRYGARKTMATALGNTCASMIQATISIAGLGAVLTASQPLFFTIKYAGAAYLIYLGLDIWRSGPMAFEPVHHGNPSEDASFGRRFAQGFYVAAANPKALVFFSALFPHFIDTMGSPLSQYLLLVVPLGFIAFVCMMIYALGGAKITGLFNLTGLKNYFNKLVGGSFIALGIGIAASDR